MAFSHDSSGLLANQILALGNFPRSGSRICSWILDLFIHSVSVDHLADLPARYLYLDVIY